MKRNDGPPDMSDLSRMDNTVQRVARPRKAKRLAAYACASDYSAHLRFGDTPPFIADIDPAHTNVILRRIQKLLEEKLR